MDDKRSNGLFSQKALDRLQSPDQLDRLFTPTTSVGWLALTSVLLLVVSAVIWSVFGVMATKVSGTGLIMDSAGLVNISHTSGGRLTDLRVTVGDRVTKGEVVGLVAQPDLESEIAKADSALNTSTSKAEMASLSAQSDQLKAKLVRDSQIVSQFDGIITDQIVSGVGDIIAPSAPLFNLRLDEKARGEMTVLLYVPVMQGKQMKPGMVVQISPGSVNASEYKTLIGQVSSVSTYPVSAASITGWTGNSELTSLLLSQNGGAVMEVKANLIKDSATVTGFLWSSINGAPLEITPGTTCTGNVVVQRQAPLGKVFLKLNQWLRSD